MNVKVRANAVIKSNIFRFIVILIAYYIYMRVYALQLPEDWRGLANAVAVPLTLGFLSYLIFSGDILVRIGFVTLIPLLSLLSIMMEGDPAKPGLQYWLIVGIASGFCTGAFAAAGIQALINKGLT